MILNIGHYVDLKSTTTGLVGVEAADVVHGAHLEGGEQVLAQTAGGFRSKV